MRDDIRCFAALSIEVSLMQCIREKRYTEAMSVPLFR